MSDTILEQLNKTLKTDEVDPNGMEQMSIIAQAAKAEIDSSITTETPNDYAGHLYPVLFVKECTLQLQNINKQIANFIKSLTELNIKNTDPYWLKNRIKKFADWINDKLSKIRQKVVNALKGMYKQAQKVVRLIEPILSPPSLDTIISWAGNIISFFTEPYQKVVTFISDFMTYTPPLVAETTTTAALVAVTAAEIQPTVDRLEGEGIEVIKEQIMVAVGAIKLEPVSMGDVTGG